MKKEMVARKPERCKNSCVIEMDDFYYKTLSGNLCTDCKEENDMTKSVYSAIVIVAILIIYLADFVKDGL